MFIFRDIHYIFFSISIFRLFQHVRLILYKFCNVTTLVSPQKLLEKCCIKIFEVYLDRVSLLFSDQVFELRNSTLFRLRFCDYSPKTFKVVSFMISHVETNIVTKRKSRFIKFSEMQWTF